MTQHNLLPSYLSNETPSAKTINSLLPLPNSKDTIQFLSFWTFLPYLTSPNGTLSWNFILLLLLASSPGLGLLAWVLPLPSFLKCWYSPGPVCSHPPPWESSSQTRYSYPSPETTKSTLLALAFPLISRPHVLVYTGYLHLEGSHHCLKLNSVAKNLPANAGDMVQSLIWEDPICRGATKPMSPNYWACAQEPRSHSDWSLCTLEPALHNKRNHHNEKPTHHNSRVAPAHHSQRKPTQQQRFSIVKNK